MTTEVISYCLTHGREHTDDETDLDFEDMLVRTEADGVEAVTRCAEDVRTVVIGTVESVNDTVNEDASDSEVFTLKAGDLAYIDTVRGGLVPCKVLNVNWTGADVQVTASRPGWNRGDVEHFINPAVALVNRAQVKRYSDGTTWIVGTLTVEEA